MFLNRKDAGRFLAGRLAAKGYAQPVVLALSRGGAVVGYEIARALEGPLGLLAGPGWTVGPELERELLEPLDPPGGPRTCGHDLARSDVAALNGSALCTCLHRSGARSLDLAGSTLILVEEGLEGRRSALAVLPALRRKAPRRIVLATPTLSFETLRELEPEFDEVFCLTGPADPRAPRDYCDEPEPVTDEAVISLLDRAASRS